MEVRSYVRESSLLGTISALQAAPDYRIFILHTGSSLMMPTLWRSTAHHFSLRTMRKAPGRWGGPLTGRSAYARLNGGPQDAFFQPHK